MRSGRYGATISRNAQPTSPAARLNAMPRTCTSRLGYHVPWPKSANAARHVVARPRSADNSAGSLDVDHRHSALPLLGRLDRRLRSGRTAEFLQMNLEPVVRLLSLVFLTFQDLVDDPRIQHGRPPFSIRLSPPLAPSDVQSPGPGYSLADMSSVTHG